MEQPSQGPQQNVESLIQLDFKQGLILVTPKSVNGISIVNPVTSAIPMNQVLVLAANIILTMEEAKARAQNADNLIVGVNQPLPFPPRRG